MQKNSSSNRFGASQTSMRLDISEIQQPETHNKYKQQTLMRKDVPFNGSRSRAGNYSSHPITSLKNDIFNLKNDFKDIFLKQDIKQQFKSPQSIKRRNLVKNQSPIYDNSESSSKYSSSDHNILQEENIALRSQIKRIQMRYQNKKQQYQQTIKLLYRKIEQMAQQLQTNQESLMVCKLQLQNEMDLIREQLRGKKDAEISLQDYGELVEINANLKQQIQCYLKTIDSMKVELQIQYRKGGDFQRQKISHIEKIQQLDSLCKVQAIKKQTIQNQIQTKISENQKLLKKVNQLEQMNYTLKKQLSTNVNKSSQTGISTQKYEQLQKQNLSLQKQLSQYLQSIGQVNAECFMFRNNYQLLQQEHKKCGNNNFNPEQKQSLENQVLKQKEVITDMVRFIKQLEDIKERLEADRSLMLKDIVYLESQLGKKDQQLNTTRVKLAEKQDQFIKITKAFEEIERNNLGKLFEQRDDKNSSGAVFVQSQQISDEVMRDFDCILNSPKIVNRPKVEFNLITQTVEYEATSSNTNRQQNQQKVSKSKQPYNPPMINHISDLKKYINGDEHSSQLAISVIVSDNKSQILQGSIGGEQLKDQSMLIDNISTISNLCQGNTNRSILEM